MKNNGVVDEARQSPDAMPDFTPPVPNRENGWHCWHVATAIAAGHTVRSFVCCHCGHWAYWQWKEVTVIPDGHGPYHPSKKVAGGGWVFEFAGSTPYVCEAGRIAAGAPPEK